MRDKQKERVRGRSPVHSRPPWGTQRLEKAKGAAQPTKGNVLGSSATSGYHHDQRWDPALFIAPRWAVDAKSAMASITARAAMVEV